MTQAPSKAEGAPTVRKTSVASDTIVILIGSVVSQAAAALIYLLVARSAGPADFGQAIAVSSLVLSLIGFAEFGTSNFATREIASGKATVQHVLHSLASRVVLVSGCGICLAGVLRILGQVSNEEALAVGLLVAGMSLSAGLQGILRGLGRVRLSIWLGASDKVLGLAVVCAVLFTNGRAGMLTLLFALGLGSWPLSLVILSVVRPNFGVRRPRWIHPYRGALGFGLTSSITSIQTIDVTAIAWLAGSRAAAEFGAVSRWTAPFNLVVQALAQATLPRLAASTTTSAALGELFKGAWVPAMSFVAAVVTSISSPWIVELLLGAEFNGAAPVLSLVALATIPSGVSQLALTLLQARGAEGRAARNIVPAVLVQLGAICIGSLFYGAVGGGAAILMTQCLLAALMIWDVVRLLHIEARQASVSQKAGT